MKYLKLFMVFSALASVMSLAASNASAQDAVVTDSRIKTLVYSPNDVFSLLMVYGYQSNIEFSEKEEIQTVSVGDRVGWQIVPAGHRLFIRPLEFGAHTNMTIITSKRSYQFDLRSAPDNKLPESEELVYVVRFFYPENAGLAETVKRMPPAYSPPSVPPALPQASVVVPSPMVSAGTFVPPVAVPAPPTPFVKSENSNVSLVGSALKSEAGLKQNYNYTYTGSIDYAPYKVYDDGGSTYVSLPKKLASNALDVEFIDSLNGNKKITDVALAGEAYVIKRVLSQFAIKYKDGTQVDVYNESSTLNK